MPILRFLLLTMVAGLATGTACATEQKAPAGVVELFTSQGCASCPPADAALQKLIQAGEVVGLSYHVDYWNYLGWSDTLASRENTERQYAYARRMGRNGVYTPQAVLNGRDHVNGADIAGIRTRLAEMSRSGEGLTVPVNTSIDDGQIRIDIGEGSGKADVVIAYFTRQQSVDVRKGQNSGKSITYWHSVEDVQTVGMWNGAAMALTLPANVLTPGKKNGCAILLQKYEANGDPGSIIGASVLYSQNDTETEQP